MQDVYPTFLACSTVSIQRASTEYQRLQLQINNNPPQF